MPTAGDDRRGFESTPDYRELLKRLESGRKTATDVTFSPVECWVLRHYIWFLLREPSGGTLNERSDEG